MTGEMPSDGGGTGGGLGGGTGGGGSMNKQECTLPGMRESRVNDPQKLITDVRALLFDAQGKLYVLDRYANPSKGRVLVFSAGPNPAWEKTFGEGVLGNVQDMTFDGQGRVHVLERGSGIGEESLINIFQADGAHAGSWKPRFDGSNGITSDGQGHLYVSTENIDVFSENGVFERQLVPAGSISAPIVWPYGMVVVSSTLWVADLVKRSLVEVVISDGRVRGSFGGKGTGLGQFDGDAPDVDVYGPSKVMSDGMGYLYANDPYQSRIQKFSEQGDFMGLFSFGGSKDVGPLAMEPVSKNIYVGRKSAIAIVCAW